MPASLTLIAAPVASFAVAVGTLSWLLRGRMRELAMDRPNERSLHARPIPRTGGLAIMAGVVAGCVLVPSLPWAALLLALTLGLLSFADDLRSLPISVRFAAQLAAAGVFTLLHLAPLPHVLWAVPVVLGIVWVSNLYNFMDGSDGLAGGMAVIGFGCLALAAVKGGDLGIATLCAVLAAAALGFLVHNFPPARVFMGDAGSVPLGFLAATLGYLGWGRGLWPAWFPVLVFSPFVVDASVTLVKRALRGERFWQAHKQHYYQRMVQIGLGHTRTALIQYALMLATGASALVALELQERNQWLLVAAWAAGYALLMVLFEVLWRGRAGPGN
ncbi:MAG TPA: glycosyltransferase family 4 protein [Burkholderiales bacterium]|nr:glycosyltransferase family 4 protein [Burkholderiales bacterium]